MLISGRGLSAVRGLWFVGLLLSLASSGVRAGEARFWLASQHDFGAKRGFYLDFENSSEGDEPCRAETLRLILGVGDGQNWRFPSVVPKWDLGRDYAVKAVMGPKEAELWLDGELVAKSEGAFLPDRQVMTINHIPAWASGAADYLILQTSLVLSASDGQHLSFSFTKETSRPLPLVLFEPQQAKRIEWAVKPGDTLTVEAAFRLVRCPDLRELAPFIDRYGQSRHAQWPGKVKSDADLKKAAEEENRCLKTWGAPQGYDRFGGYKLSGRKEKATGFYRVIRKNGFWWLISPEGNLCFYLGVCTAPGLSWEMTPTTGREFLFEWLPPRQAPYASAWSRNVWGDGETEYVAFHTANMIRKYGRGWDRKATQSTARRLKGWGFSGIGKWGGMDGLPFSPVLNRAGVPNVARHPDIFDPGIRAQFREELRKQIEPRRKDPFVLGWSLGNEYDEIILKSEIEDILKKPADIPAKRALIDFALGNLYGKDEAKMARSWEVEASTRQQLYASRPKPPAGDLERLRHFFADRYYAFIYRTVKEMDPNHLYMGFWIVPGWWENEQDWRLITPHCDIIGYDRYADRFAEEGLMKLMRESGKPVLCGEFSFPAWYGGERGYGMYGTWVEDDIAAGKSYRQWTVDAANNPYCVGLMWFHYRDQPLTGRGPGRGHDLTYGEHYAFGVVDMTDRPKWNLVERMREANLKAVKWRLEATKKGLATRPGK